MHTGTLIMNMIMIGGSLAPFILVYRNKRKIKKDLIIKLKEQINDPRVELTDIENQLGLVICSDKNYNSIYFLKTYLKETYYKKINTGDINSCKLIKTWTENSNAKETDQRISRVDLILNLSNQEVLLLNFYDEINQSNLNGELQFAEKCCGYIQQKIILNQENSVKPMILEGEIN
jgi:hypothetical protein